MNLKQLADLTAWTIPKVSALERGADPPPRLKSNIKKIAGALGLDATELARLAEDQELRMPLF